MSSIYNYRRARPAPMEAAPGRPKQVSFLRAAWRRWVPRPVARAVGIALWSGATCGLFLLLAFAAVRGAAALDQTTDETPLPAAVSELATAL